MTYVYVGTVNWGSDNALGTYSFILDDDDGTLTPLRLTLPAESRFVVTSRKMPRLYAAISSTHFEGEPGSGLISYAIDLSNGDLLRLNHQVVPGPHANYLSLDRSERFLLVACGFGGTASILPLTDDGEIGPVTDTVHFEGRPTVPLGEHSSPPFDLALGASHPHCIRPSPDNRFVVVTDMPRSHVNIFAFSDRDGRMVRHSSVLSPPNGQGYGARHFEWHPNGRILYVVNERSNSITVFEYEARTAALKPISTVPALPASFSGTNFTADIHIDSFGRFLYVCNRGHDSIAVFAVDPQTGMLDIIGWDEAYGHRPRSFALSPDERFMLVANSSSDNLVSIRLDNESGRLGPLVSNIFVPAPTQIAFMQQLAC
jgi:6-phosphogluconolactonase